MFFDHVADYLTLTADLPRTFGMHSEYTEYTEYLIAECAANFDEYCCRNYSLEWLAFRLATIYQYTKRYFYRDAEKITL